MPEEIKHSDPQIDDFEKLSTNINMYIKSLNFKSRGELVERGIQFFNEYAFFDNDNQVTN